MCGFQFKRESEKNHVLVTRLFFSQERFCFSFKYTLSHLSFFKKIGNHWFIYTMYVCFKYESSFGAIIWTPPSRDDDFMQMLKDLIMFYDTTTRNNLAFGIDSMIHGIQGYGGMCSVSLHDILINSLMCDERIAKIFGRDTSKRYQQKMFSCYWKQCFITKIRVMLFMLWLRSYTYY